MKNSENKTILENILNLSKNDRLVSDNGGNMTPLNISGMYIVDDDDIISIKYIPDSLYYDSKISKTLQTVLKRKFYEIIILGDLKYGLNVVTNGVFLELQIGENKDVFQVIMATKCHGLINNACSDYTKLVIIDNADSIDLDGNGELLQSNSNIKIKFSPILHLRNIDKFELYSDFVTINRITSYSFSVRWIKKSSKYIYHIRYKKSTNNNWTYIKTPNNPHVIEDVDSDSIYEVQLCEYDKNSYHYTWFSETYKVYTRKQ